MSKFLDGIGLKGLWHKIKDLFGGSFREKDGVFDVAIPVNGVISEEDFEALEPEKKNHGVWIVKTEDSPDQP